MKLPHVFVRTSRVNNYFIVPNEDKIRRRKKKPWIGFLCWIARFHNDRPSVVLLVSNCTPNTPRYPRRAILTVVFLSPQRLLPMMGTRDEARSRRCKCTSLNFQTWQRATHNQVSNGPLVASQVATWSYCRSSVMNFWMSGRECV